jgi:RNA polymerase-binding transcription factor
MNDVRKRLERELDEALAKLRQLGIMPADDEQAVRPDSQSVNDIGDVAQVNERRELEFGTRERLGERISRLDAALQRLDAGHYGICERCGRPIHPARLQALPEAPLCRDCQEEAERMEGPARRASL